MSVTTLARLAGETDSVEETLTGTVGGVNRRAQRRDRAEAQAFVDAVAVGAGLERRGAGTVGACVGEGGADDPRGEAAAPEGGLGGDVLDADVVVEVERERDARPIAVDAHAVGAHAGIVDRR